MRLLDRDAIIEQIALLFASFVWTIVVLSGLAMFWVYQDINARWEVIANMPPEALAQAADPTATVSPSPTATATLWAGPGPTATPTATQPPTVVPTQVIEAPAVLPETLNIDEPTPIPVIVHTEDEAEEFGLEEPTEPVSVPPTPAPEATPQTLPVPTDAPPTQPPTVEDVPTAPTMTPTAPPAVEEPVDDNEPADDAPPASGDLIPDRLVIDSVGIDSPVVPVGWQIVEQSGQQYSIWQVADFAVGWHNTTAKIGQPGNTVMAGHHNVKGEVFRDLVNVEVGDRITIFDGGQPYEYVVELKTIVKEKGEPLEVRQRNAQWIASTDDERMTFVTCWPYTNNTHRVIVVAKPV